MRHWFLFRPGMYDWDIKMATDEEFVALKLFGYDIDDKEILARLKGVFVGDWISIRDGIAIRLRDGLFDSEQVSS